MPTVREPRERTLTRSAQPRRNVQPISDVEHAAWTCCQMSQSHDEHYSLDDIRRHLYTAVLSDVLDHLGCTGQATWSDLRPLTDDMVGWATPERCVRCPSG